MSQLRFFHLSKAEIKVRLTKYFCAGSPRHPCWSLEGSEGRGGEGRDSKRGQFIINTYCGCYSIDEKTIESRLSTIQHIHSINQGLFYWKSPTNCYLVPVYSPINRVIR